MMPPFATPVHDRDLDAEELTALALAFAADRPAWEPYVRADADRRACHPLLRTPAATVWLLCWMPGQDTGFHDHDGAAGAVAVLQGRVCEERLRLGAAPLSSERGTGEVFTFGGSTIHRVGHAAGAPAVTIHAYSPALRRMGAYDFDERGELHRRALDEDVELGAPQPRLVAV
jgi:predicted metal-dependent enzyme (double-stranded beta helix superfamily)